MGKSTWYRGRKSPKIQEQEDANGDAGDGRGGQVRGQATSAGWDNYSGGEGGAVYLLYLHCTDVRWSTLEHMLSGALMISTC